MNPAPCGVKGGESPGEKSSEHLLVFADYRKPGGAVELTCYTVRFLLPATKVRKKREVHV